MNVLISPLLLVLISIRYSDCNNEQSSTKTNGRPSQGILDTLTGLHQFSLRYTDELAYQSALIKCRVHDVDTSHTFEALKTANMITHPDLR